MMLGENPVVSLDVNEWPHLWTARLVRFSHNMYRFAVRESATILERIASSDEVRVLLQDDLRGLVTALRAKARILESADPSQPGKVVVELAFEPA